MKSVHESSAVVYDLSAIVYNNLLYLNRGLPGSAVYDLSTVRQMMRRTHENVLAEMLEKVLAYNIFQITSNATPGRQHQ